MSKVSEILKYVESVVNGHKGMVSKGVDYSRSADVDSTAHYYTLTLVTPSNKILSIRLTTNFTSMYNAKGADYSLMISVTANNAETVVYNSKISVSDRNSEFVIGKLRECGLKI